VKSVESVLRLEGSLRWERFVKEVTTNIAIANSHTYSIEHKKVSDLATKLKTSVSSIQAPGLAQCRNF